MAYGIKYRCEFLSDYDKTPQRIDILQRDYTGALEMYTPSASPITITYKNKEDDKFSVTSAAEFNIGLIATSTFNIETFYTEDERGWLIRYYKGSAYTLELSGFIIPDTASEPFISYPLPFTLQASDLLNTLKDIPYTTSEGILIKKVDVISTILAECLAKTNLDLNIVIGVNTYEITQGKTTSDCPLNQTYIDTNRFIDGNNSPYSCLDIIEALCRQFTANLVQAAGAWYFVDQSQKTLSSYPARRYTYLGVKLASFITVDNTSMVAGIENIVNKDLSVQKVPAYKTVSNYYQYGYLSNKLLNGDFNIVNPSPVVQRFPNWTQLAGIVPTAGQKSIDTPSGTVLINDFYAIIENANNANPGRYIVSDPVPVLTTTKIGVTMFVQAPSTPANPPSDWHAQFTFKVSLTASGQTQMFWNGVGWGTDTGATIGIDVSFDDLSRGTSINFSTGYPPFAGDTSIYISGAQVRPTFQALRVYIDDVKLNLDESQYYKSAIGYVDQLTNFGSYSQKPETSILLFGDDTNRNRTSYMRLSNGNPTTQWRKTPASAYMVLQRIGARNILNQYYKPTRRLEGSFRGNYSAISVISIAVLSASFSVLSGEFNPKTGIHKLVLAELLTGEYTGFNESQFQDFGDYSSTSGSSVGSIGGVSVPPSGSDDTNVIKATDAQTQAGTEDGAFITPLKLANWWVYIKGIFAATLTESLSGTITDKYISPAGLQYWFAQKINSLVTITNIWSVPTAAAGTNTGQIASTAFTAAAIAAFKGTDKVINTAVNYTVLSTDFGSNGACTVYVDTTSGNISITIPTLAALNGYSVNVIKTSADLNSVMIQCVTSGVLINGIANDFLSDQYDSAIYKTNGTAIFKF